MIPINTNKASQREEMVAALTDVYLELRLSFRAAEAAAKADLELLDASEFVKEAA